MMRKIFRNFQVFSPKKAHPLWASVFLVVISGLGNPVHAEAPLPQKPGDLTNLSLEELMGIEVTSVSKKKQKLSESAAAIFVITEEDLRRSGATSIPEALRMVPGIQVGRITNNQWAISARGLNDRFSNTLLVLIDGRTIYNPLFAGVTWETQDTTLEDIARIEVIRGPGGTLWGVNAVNGVINIITKNSQETQGVLTSVVAGPEEGILTIRHGGKSGNNLSYRLFTKYFNRDAQFAQGGAHDDSRMVRGGFRADWTPTEQDTLMVQGELYAGEGGQQNTVATTNTFPFNFTTINEDIEMGGGHILARWNKQLALDSDMALQFFYDRFNRNEALIKATIDTLDLEFQHRFPLFSGQDFLWGLGYRFWTDDLVNTPTQMTFPNSRTFHLFSGFLQNEFTLVPNSLKLTLGTKLSHNSFTGFEYQPSGRLLWTFSDNQTVWGAISRAVRIPSRFEDNAQLHLPPNSTFPVPVTSTSNPTFRSESLLAFEIGYRFSGFDKFLFDLSGFYNTYDDIRGSQVTNPFPPAIQLTNAIEVQALGAELAGDFRLMDWWTVKAAYSYINLSVDVPSGVTAGFLGGLTPKHQASIRSLIQLPYHVEFDSWIRFVDDLKGRAIGAYTELDLRLGWNPLSNLNISLFGQNLLDNHHPEFISSFLKTQATERQRSAYVKVTWTF